MTFTTLVILLWVMFQAEPMPSNYRQALFLAFALDFIVNYPDIKQGWAMIFG